MDSIDFIEYLKQTCQTGTGQQSLFTPGFHDEGGDETWTPLKQPKPVSKDELTEAEKRLNCQLPAGYRTFMEVLGPGTWADAGIPHPKALYAFDDSVGEMCGYIAVGCNVDGCGNYVAFDQKGEANVLHFCCHDTSGHAVVAKSFEEWIKKIAELKYSDPEGAYEFYNSLESFKETVLPGLENGSRKPWWQFW